MKVYVLYMFDHTFSFPLRMRNVTDKRCRGNQNIFYFVFNNFFFFKSCHL